MKVRKGQSQPEIAVVLCRPFYYQVLIMTQVPSSRAPFCRYVLLTLLVQALLPCSSRVFSNVTQRWRNATGRTMGSQPIKQVGVDPWALPLCPRRIESESGSSANSARTSELHGVALNVISRVPSFRDEPCGCGSKSG